jgi:GxxExxY protein
MLYKETTDKIIKCFFEVYNILGYGFLEKVYENALYDELIRSGLNCERQKKIQVFYKNNQVGEYYADILVENKIILELKAAEAICEEHEFQLINYLKATDLEIGLLLNFGKKPEIKRKIFTNDRKIMSNP